jgi:hypothetical protein
LLELHQKLVVFVSQTGQLLDQRVELGMLNQQVSDLGLGHSCDWEKRLACKSILAC